MKKNCEVRVKLSTEELEKIKHKADKLGMTISGFLRMLGLNADITPTNVL